MGGFVRDCRNMSLQNTVKFMEALDRPYGQGGLPVKNVDPQIGTATQEIQFGTFYQARFDNGAFADEIAADPTLIQRGKDALDSLFVKGYECTGIDFLI